MIKIDEPYNLIKQQTNRRVEKLKLFSLFTDKGKNSVDSHLAIKSFVSVTTGCNLFSGM